MEHIAKSRLTAAISYVPLLFLVPLLSGADRYAQHHGKQGLMLFFAWFGSFLVGLIPFYIGKILYPLLFLSLIVLSLIGVVQALLGREWEMPFLGKLARQIRL